MKIELSKEEIEQVLSWEYVCLQYFPKKEIDEKIHKKLMTTIEKPQDKKDGER